MPEQVYDVAVIGSGPGGEKAAVEAAKYGAKVVIFEKGIRPGGASVITGTIPSKSLRETVKYVELITRNDISGVDVGLNRRITIKELMHRKNRVITQRVDDILETYRKQGVDYIFGAARFVSPEEIEVDSLIEGAVFRVKAKTFIIAVGTVPYHPPDVAFDGKKILDSDSVLELDYMPETIAVYGGGVIGCEYANMFNKLGIQTYLIDPRGTLLNFLDHEISALLAEKFERDGITLKLGEEYQEIKQIDDGVKITLKSGEELKTTALFYANGRQGMAGKLNLEACGLQVNERSQLDVNHNYQTAVPHIYAVGDVIGFPSLVSTSNEEGRLAVRHACLGEEVTRVGSDIPWGIYTIPEISMVGFTESELKEKEEPYEVGICHYKDLARGLIIGDREGLLKLTFDRNTRQLLGVHIFGQSAAELVHIGQAVINFGGKIDYFTEVVFNFPTLSSAYKVAAMDGLSKL
jgi:NAD(P) transhydrogenase